MFTFTASPDNGDEFTATATSRDVVAWEKEGRGRSLLKVQEGGRMSDLYSLAYVASRRKGLFTGTYEDFETNVDVEFHAPEEDGAADPTRKAR